MASQGRAFCLFTSYRTLDQVYAILSEHLPFLCLKQGALPRAELLRRFKENQPAVLFATRSFWEGVDVAGEALSLVIIDKMPFSVPDDPVIEARVARMKERGEDWFGGMVLPAAILGLKQGFGRLIRSKDDRGVVAILDSRLLSRGYGRTVLAALPPAQQATAIGAVRAFFNTAPTSGS
jgi:Rad3-related DNA helicase